MPETAELFLDVFESPGLWLHPAHDSPANLGAFTLGGEALPDRTYGAEEANSLISVIGPGETGCFVLSRDLHVFSKCLQGDMTRIGIEALLGSDCAAS